MGLRGVFFSSWKCPPTCIGDGGREGEGESLLQ